MLITIINSCDSAPDMDEDGNIKTKKKDKEHHGVGLKSVKQAVQRLSLIHIWCGVGSESGRPGRYAPAPRPERQETPRDSCSP